MKFRYFKLVGESLAEFLADEREEMLQRDSQRRALLKDRDDVEGFRCGRNGRVLSIKFKEGRRPDGFVMADRKLSKDEVKPSSRDAASKEWRELLESIRVTVDCQAMLRKRLRLPDFVPGMLPSCNTGMALYHSRAGHVGQDVYVEVPLSGSSSDPKNKPFAGHPDLEPCETWEYVKCAKEAEGFSYAERCYVLESRV